ncbi:MAG: hypothetical protein Q7S84_03095 [bacterium]|nr:hypothetical protein [bacterium]
MKNIFYTKSFFAFSIAVALVGGIAFPALAEVTDVGGGLKANVDVNGPVRVGGVKVEFETGARTNIKADLKARATARADQEIDRRIAKLEQQNARIQAMQRIGVDEKGSLDASIKAHLVELTDLKAKIHADTDAATFRSDIQSITKLYRIFALVMPKAAITAAAGRTTSVAKSISDLAMKLDTRISAAASSGKDVSALQTSLADMQVKTADATIQANAALALIANLSPDNGDQAMMQANLKALQDARVKIKAGEDDLKTARKDAETIMKGLRSFGIRASATTTVSSTLP